MNISSTAQTISSTLRKPRHGGDLEKAIAEFGGRPDDWLDLSTGISPWTYPRPSIDENIWRNLPPSAENLLSAAASFYQCEESILHLTPGSQLAIRVLPRLICAPISVAIPQLGYQEHCYSWQSAGHTVKRYSNFAELRDLVNQKTVTNAVVINPNNPSCEQVSAQSLASISEDLSGILLVDEAFADLDDSQSLCKLSRQLENVITLRSLGKFFGLAGARVGFVIGQHSLVLQLNDLLNPWSTNAAAMLIAEYALRDTSWQTMQRQRIKKQSNQLNSVLTNFLKRHHRVANSEPSTTSNIGRDYITHCDQGLFTTLSGSSENIQQLHQQLAKKNIWTRLGDSYLNRSGQQKNWLRLSLPGERFEQLASVFDTLNEVP